LTVLAIGLAAALTATTGAASTTPVVDDARNAKIEQALAEDARRSRVWYTGWTAFYTVATGFSMKNALDSDSRDRRVSSAVDAMRSGLGLLTTVLIVPPSMNAPTIDDAAGREKWLEKAAGAERRGRSWVVHVANAAVNAAGGGYLWLHEHRLGAGLLAFLSGTLIGELKIWTQPMTARNTVDELRTAKVDVQLAFTPIVSDSAFALALDGRF
jgi:hypothetical protein